MAHTLVFQDFIDSNQDARLLNIAKAVVDGRTKKLHRRRQAHISVHQRGNVVTQLTDLAIEDAVIVFEGILAEELFQFLGV